MLPMQRFGQRFPAFAIAPLSLMSGVDESIVTPLIAGDNNGYRMLSRRRRNDFRRRRMHVASPTRYRRISLLVVMAFHGASEIVEEIILCEPRYPDQFLGDMCMRRQSWRDVAECWHRLPAAAVKVVPFRGIKEQWAKSRRRADRRKVTIFMWRHPKRSGRLVVDFTSLGTMTNAEASFVDS